MADETIISMTLETRGEAAVPLDTIAETLKGLDELISLLGKEVAPGTPVIWGIAELRMGSATVALRPIKTNLGSEYGARRIGAAVTAVAEAAARGDYAGIPYSPNVRRAAVHLMSALTEDVPAINLGTRGSVARIVKTDREVIIDRGISFGTVSGTVYGINGHQDPRFTLYDDVFDNGIRCFMADSGVPWKLEDLYKKRVEVTGIVTADPATGMIESVTQIEDIVILDDTQADYTKTKGVWRDWDSNWQERRDALRAVRRGQ